MSNSRVAYGDDRRRLAYFCSNSPTLLFSRHGGRTGAHTAGRLSWPFISEFIVISQIIMALLAPWVDRTAATWGRRPILLIGLRAAPVRSWLFAITADPTLLLLIQVLDGISGATLGVRTPLVIADLTNGAGRFNLAQGLVGALSGVGAWLKTSILGLFVSRFG